MRKTILIIFTLLLLPALCSAGALQNKLRAVIDKKNTVVACTDANPAGTCTGFLVCQNFETTAEACTNCSEDNSETWSKTLTGDGAATVDSTSSPLRGSQSLLLSRGTGTAQIYKDFTASDTIYGFARLSLVDGRPATGQNTIIWYTGSTTVVGYLYLGTSGKFRIYHGTAYQETATVLPDGATGVFYVWWYYSLGTGADGHFGFAMSTSSKTFTAWEKEATNGTSTGQANRVRIYDQYINGIGADQVLIKTTAIGTVCD